MRKNVENLPRLVQAEDWHYQPRAARILATLPWNLYRDVPRCAVRPRTLTEVDVCRGYGTDSVLTYDELVSRDLSPAEKQEVKAQWEECRDEPTVMMAAKIFGVPDKMLRDQEEPCFDRGYPDTFVPAMEAYLTPERFEHLRKLSVMAQLAAERLKNREHVAVFVRTKPEAEAVMRNVENILMDSPEGCTNALGNWYRLYTVSGGRLDLWTGELRSWTHGGCNTVRTVIYDSALRPKPEEDPAFLWCILRELIGWARDKNYYRTVIGVKERSR